MWAAIGYVCCALDISYRVNPRPQLSNYTWICQNGGFKSLFYGPTRIVFNYWTIMAVSAFLATLGVVHMEKARYSVYVSISEFSYDRALGNSAPVYLYLKTA